MIQHDFQNWCALMDVYCVSPLLTKVWATFQNSARSLALASITLTQTQNVEKTILVLDF